MKNLFLPLFAAALVSQARAAQVRVEAPPTVPAAQLLPAEIVSGTDYTIDPKVPTDGFVGIFQLHTMFGDYACAGREMLFVRLQELRALEEIDRVSKTGAFAKAAVQGAVGEPVEAAEKIATHPVRSVEETPLGVARLVGKVAGGFADFGTSVGKLAGGGEKSPSPGDSKPPPSREDPIGYNEARNEWAHKFGVDPYTTNRPLALKLNHLGMITFSVDKIAGAGSGMVAGGLGPIAEWLSYLPDVDEHILTEPPADVTKYNARRLAQLGVSKQAMAPLLDNPWFTPPLQTRFVNALAKMQGVAGIPVTIELAGNAESEEQTRFLCGSLELLVRTLGAVPEPRQIRAFGGLPAVTGADGALLVAAPVDLLSWTDVVAAFAAQHKPADGKALLCVTGPLTERARAGFVSLGWQVTDVSSPRQPLSPISP